MQLLISILIIFMPFIFLIPLAKNTMKLMEIEETTKLPSSISLLSSVDKNHTTLMQYLTEDIKLIEAEALKICNIFKATQQSVIGYIGGGILQVFSILLYCIWIYKNIDFQIFYNTNLNQLSVYIGTVIMACVTFWIFYGNQLLEYIGFNKVKRAINAVISVLFETMETLQKKIVIFFSSALYFVALLLYLYFLLPLAYQMGEGAAGYPLIGICVLIFLFYYGVPNFFAIVYAKVFKKSCQKIDKSAMRETLKNTTYLHLLIVFFYGILVHKENSLLLSGITILFLYDTYLYNKKSITGSKKT